MSRSAWIIVGVLTVIALAASAWVVETAGVPFAPFFVPIVTIVAIAVWTERRGHSCGRRDAQ